MAEFKTTVKPRGSSWVVTIEPVGVVTSTEFKALYALFKRGPSRTVLEVRKVGTYRWRWLAERAARKALSKARTYANMEAQRRLQRQEAFRAEQVRAFEIKESEL